MHGLRQPSRRLKWLTNFLAVALIQPWGLMGAAYAAYVEETALNLPVDSSDSYAFDAADINGDSIADLIVANRGQSSLLVSNGTGGFADETAARLPAALHTSLDAVFVDVDGLNGVDLLLVGEGQNRLLMNDGNGVFTDETATRMPVGDQTSLAIAVGDLDNDGDQDAVVGNRAGRNQILINDGSGIFTDDSDARLSTDADFTYGVALGDTNSDGALDIFFANFSGQNRLHANNFLGVFTDVTAANLPLGVASSGDAVFLDADGDGDQDIAIADGPGGVSLLTNAGGVYADASAQVAVLDSFAVKVDVGDINFDGFVDLLVSSLGQDSVLLNDGLGTFNDATGSEMPNDVRRTFAAQMLDADLDLDLDYVAATPQGQNRYFENAIAAPRVELGVSPDYIEVTDTATIDVNIFDEDGIASSVVEVEQPGGATVPAPTDLGGGQYSYVPAVIGVHIVRVTASDTFGESIVRTTTFNAQANDITAPTVTTLAISANPILQGTNTNFSVAATDDRGVTNLTLSVGGVNVPLNAAGQATYAPTTTGALAVVAVATDAAGNSGQASDTLQVNPDVDAPVVALTATPDPVDITNPIAVTATATDNIGVLSFAVTVTGPAGGPIDEPVPLDAGGNGSYTPFVPGTYTFSATAIDPAGNSTTEQANVEAQGVPDAENPVVNLTATPGATIPGGTVTLTVNATDNIFVLARTLEINGLPQTLDANHQVTFSPPSLGSYTAVATATDPTGNVGSDTVVFQAVDPASDTDAPVVALTAPAEGSDIAGVTTFAGTASDLTLVSYELAYRPVGVGGAFTVFHTGTGVVEDDALGDLDTSVLDNGLVEIRLAATDINGLTSTVSRVYTADGAFKPGVFTIEYTDLSVPVAGIPISIKREYDSRRRGQSQDFGNGWNLEVVQDATYTNNRPVGDGWFITSGGGFLNPPCSVSNESAFHITEIRFSDSEFYKFAPTVTFFGFGSAISGGCFGGQASFSQVGGIPGATLEIIGSNDVGWTNGSNQLTYDFSDPLFGQVWSPTDVRLTTLDGRVYDLNINQGLERIGDQNGNSVFINANAVVHSNGQSVSFTRDGAGRITSITDPLGNSLTYAYDTDGNLASYTDRNGNQTNYFYVADNFLERIDDPLGNTPLRNEYDASGRLIAQIDADGNRSQFDRDVAAGTETITERDGSIAILQYDDSGNLTSGTAGGLTATYTYDANGNRLTETDPNGNTKTFAYNANDQMTSESDGLGNAMTYAYDGSGRIGGVTDPTGSALNFTYDAAGNLTEQRDADGNLVQGFVINGDGDPTQITTAGGTTLLAYDAQGNVTQKSEPNGLVRNFAYDALGRPVSETVTRTAGGSPIAETTSYTYDANGNLLTKTDPLNGVTTFTYDGSDRKLTETDPLGRVTSFTYSSRGDLTRTDYADGTFELRGYDLQGRNTAITNTGGNTRFFDYDANDNLTRIIYADGSSTISTYDGAGNRLTQTDAGGNTTTWSYDAANRVATRTDPTGAVITNTYTGNQINPTTVTDARGNVTTYAYDTSMLFTEYLVQTTHPDSNVRAQTWGANSRVTSKTDENGNFTSFAYDAAGNLTSATDALGNVTTYTYDELGNQLTQIDANGRTTAFAYDALGRRISKTLPMGQIETWTYDAVGNMLTHTDFNSATTTHEYDQRNRLVRRVFPDTSEETYTYTDGGLLASVTDATGTATFTYDARDRMLSATAPDGAAVGYTYDGSGNRASVVSAAGSVVYGYDAARQVSTVTDRDGGVTSYSYDANGNVTGIGYPNGTAAVLAYDTRDRTLRVTHSGPGGTPVLADYQYSLDAVGNRLQVIEAAGRTLDLSYDALNQLTQVIENPAGAALATNYTYDDVGNILTIAMPGTTVTATYDLNDRILTAAGRDYAYDDNGNLLSITDGSDVTSFVYDSLNQLVSRTEASGVVTQFQYDPAGNRIARIVDGVVTNYVVDDNDPSGVAQVIEERDGSGALQATYAHGHGPVRMERGTDESFYHPDALGSTRVLTDSAGNATDTYDYDAFGNVVASSGSTQNDFQFTGEQKDPSTGLSYLRARYYDPEVARFISRDPHQGDLMIPATLHPYKYALNNPQNMIDPNGEFGLISISISISITATLATIAYNTIIKPAKDVYDKIQEIRVAIPNGVLNKEGTADSLGFTAASVEAALQQEDITQIVNLGGGIVEKSYGIVYGMSTTMGKVVALIHARNAATWMGYLPEHNNIPGNYVDCGYNNYVQKTYALGWVTGLAAAKRFQLAANIIAAYLAYFNFLVLVGETVSDSVALPQPVPDNPDDITACSIGGS